MRISSRRAALASKGQLAGGTTAAGESGAGRRKALTVADMSPVEAAQAQLNTSKANFNAEAQAAKDTSAAQTAQQDEQKQVAALNQQADQYQGGVLTVESYGTGVRIRDKRGERNLPFAGF
jgi:hypothetical protein